MINVVKNSIISSNIWVHFRQPEVCDRKLKKIMFSFFNKLHTKTVLQLKEDPKSPLERAGSRLSTRECPVLWGVCFGPRQPPPSIFIFHSSFPNSL